jgi:processive 1,2-diacylglycerol beta-glucosyltransferase
VPPLFETLRGTRTGPGPDLPPKVLYLVNPGQGNAVAILRHLGSVEGIELSAACGRDERLRASLQKTADGFRKPFRIAGWMPDLPRAIAASHLVVGKAGGATVQECLAAATPLVMSQVIPGQEEGNAELLTKADCGCTATSPQSVAAAVRHAFARGAAVWKTWEANAWNIGTPDGARNSALAVLGEAGLKADSPA